MTKRQPTFAAHAAAIEMIVIVAAIWGWIALTPGVAVLVTLAAAGLLIGSLFLRWHGIKLDRNQEWLNASAVVDKEVVEALEAAGTPLWVIRAVQQVGSRASVREFRDLMRLECPDLPVEDLAAILPYTRAARLPASPPPSSADASSSTDTDPQFRPVLTASQ